MTFPSVFVKVPFCFTCCYDFFFFFNDTATTEIYTLSLHDALPISGCRGLRCPDTATAPAYSGHPDIVPTPAGRNGTRRWDRPSGDRHPRSRATRGRGRYERRI